MGFGVYAFINCQRRDYTIKSGNCKCFFMIDDVLLWEYNIFKKGDTEIMIKKLFHGSSKVIERPLYGAGKAYNDYGLGFYCTESLEMAKREFDS